MSMSIQVGIFQFDIIWEDFEANREKIYALLNGLDKVPEILFLPEMYATGFQTNPLCIEEKLFSDQINWQKNVSEKFGLVIMGSNIVKEDNFFKNQLLISAPQLPNCFYDKRHLTRLENSRNLFRPGTRTVIYNYNGIKIFPQICYDLRFPAWSRNTTGYHIACYAANWPAERQIVWEALLQARAIENYCYTIGVNRTGTDENGISYKGGSAIYGPRGERIISLGKREEYAEVSLSIGELIQFRNSFGAYKDADVFEIKNPENSPPGYIFDDL